MLQPLFVGPMELGIGLAIIILLFGAHKIPDIARSLGRAPGELKRGAKESGTDLDFEEEA